MIGMKFKGMTYTKQMVDDRKKICIHNVEDLDLQLNGDGEKMSKFKL